jgi:hypothetical protein
MAGALAIAGGLQALKIGVMPSFFVFNRQTKTIAGCDAAESAS